MIEPERTISRAWVAWHGDPIAFAEACEKIAKQARGVAAAWRCAQLAEPEPFSTLLAQVEAENA